jgi:hypothetical protein
MAISRPCKAAGTRPGSRRRVRKLSNTRSKGAGARALAPFPCYSCGKEIPLDLLRTVLIVSKGTLLFFCPNCHARRRVTIPCRRFGDAREYRSRKWLKRLRKAKQARYRRMARRYNPCKKVRRTRKQRVTKPDETSFVYVEESYPTFPGDAALDFDGSSTPVASTPERILLDQIASDTRRSIRNVVEMIPESSRAFYLYLQQVFEEIVVANEVDLNLRKTIVSIIGDLVKSLPHKRMSRIELQDHEMAHQVVAYASEDRILGSLHEYNADFQRCTQLQILYNDRFSWEGQDYVNTLRWGDNADPNFLSNLMKFLRSWLDKASSSEQDLVGTWAIHWAVHYLRDILRLAIYQPHLRATVIQLNMGRR